MIIALGFWGLTRSLKNTIKSIEEKIINILKLNNIELKIFLHTYIINDIYNNGRAGEKNIILDNNEYKLLNPDYYIIDDQKLIINKINLLKYRSHNDAWNTNYTTTNNFILAMYSKQELTNLITSSNIKFDYIIFLRPDVKYLNDFNINFLNYINDNIIAVPNFHLFSNFNDRFAICNYNNYNLYGNLFDKLYEYSLENELHSETFNYHYIKKFNLNIIYIPFYFNRIRANGCESKDNNINNLIII